jgi:hypothetical protein
MDIDMDIDMDRESSKLGHTADILAGISFALQNLNEALRGAPLLTDPVIADIYLTCSVLNTASSDLRQVVSESNPESAVTDEVVYSSDHERVWKDYDGHLKLKYGTNAKSLFNRVHGFSTSLSDILTGKADPDDTRSRTMQDVMNNLHINSTASRH